MISYDPSSRPSAGVHFLVLRPWQSVFGHVRYVTTRRGFNPLVATYVWVRSAPPPRNLFCAVQPVAPPTTDGYRALGK
jgi:hypothetical protein